MLHHHGVMACPEKNTIKSDCFNGTTQNLTSSEIYITRLKYPVDKHDAAIWLGRSGAARALG